MRRLSMDVEWNSCQQLLTLVNDTHRVEIRIRDLKLTSEPEEHI